MSTTQPSSQSDTTTSSHSLHKNSHTKESHPVNLGPQVHMHKRWPGILTDKSLMTLKEDYSSIHVLPLPWSEFFLET